DPHLELFRERVHDRNADTVKTAGNLVCVLVELSAGVQDGHRELYTGNLFSWMNVDRDSAAVVCHGDGIVGVNYDFDLLGVTGERFIDRVVDYLVDQVMQSTRGSRADVHSRPFAHGFETFEYLNLA